MLLGRPAQVDAQLNHRNVRLRVEVLQHRPCAVIKAPVGARRGTLLADIAPGAEHVVGNLERPVIPAKCLLGPGEFFGTKQSGMPALQIGNIIRDGDILDLARAEASAFIGSPPSEGALRAALAYLREHWQRRYGLVLVG